MNTVTLNELLRRSFATAKTLNVRLDEKDFVSALPDSTESAI